MRSAIGIRFLLIASGRAHAAHFVGWAIRADLSDWRLQERVRSAASQEQTGQSYTAFRNAKRALL
jgi:hypothetical protein